jgi:endogenous inhibitor of DNA gyrase (YacG/DUF329 family)/ABC-type siderophore export system fused ATPase/permease subunit
MLSHACARCGRPLDPSSRSFVPSLAMWVARCPRCGLAVRWNVRRAREPFRLWARTRALNLRLGVALGAGQFAGLLASIYAAIIGNEASFYGAPFEKTGSQLAELLALVVLLGGFMALAAAVSAVNFAPHRGLPTRIACAWILGALPVPLGLLVLGMTPQPQEVRHFIGEVLTHLGVPLYLAYLSIPVLLSAVFALVLGPAQGAVMRRVLRRHFRRNAERLRGLWPDARRMHRATPPDPA